METALIVRYTPLPHFYTFPVWLITGKLWHRKNCRYEWTILGQSASLHYKCWKANLSKVNATVVIWVHLWKTQLGLITKRALLLLDHAQAHTVTAPQTHYSNSAGRYCRYFTPLHSGPHLSDYSHLFTPLNEIIGGRHFQSLKFSVLFFKLNISGFTWTALVPRPFSYSGCL